MALGQDIFDEDGTHWVSQGKAKFVEALDEESSGRAWADSPADSRSIEERLLEMPFEKVLAIVQPVMLAGDFEYRLTDDGAREYTTRLLEDAANTLRTGKLPSVAAAPREIGDPGAELDFVTSESSGVVREGRSVIGTDNRSNMSSVSNTWPWRMVATFVSNSGKCTAFKFFNQHTVATAAHCVHNGEGFKPRKSLTFGAPTAALGTLPSGCYNTIVPAGWSSVAGLGTPDEHNLDYAVIALRGRGNAWCDPNQYSTGWYGASMVVNGATGIDGYVAGYPASPPSGTYPAIFTHFVTNGGWQPTTALGSLRYTNDTTGGQSGGPYANGDIMWGINGGQGSGWNAAARWTTAMSSLFSAAAGF